MYASVITSWHVVNTALELRDRHNEDVNLVEPQSLFHWYAQSHPVVNSAVVNATGIVIHTYVTVTAQFTTVNKLMMTTNKVMLNTSQLFTAKSLKRCKTCDFCCIFH